MSLNLIVHAGGSKVERPALSLVKMPETTRSFHPVDHGKFVDLLEDELGNVDLKFGSQMYALNREGAQMFGIAEVLGTGLSDNDTWRTIVGFRGSHDHSLARGLVFGDGVFVCDNLAFHGEIQFGRKHTTNIMRDLRPLVADAVSQVRGRAQQQAVRYERYQRAELKDQLVNHAIIQMLRQGVINTQRVEKVVQEYYEPSHPEHLINGKRTIWTLHNAATEALKGVSLATLPQRTIKLQTLMDTATDYALAA